MILAQVRDEMNQVNRVLDELESMSLPRGRGDRKAYEGRRRELRGRALRASKRGVEALMSEPWISDPAVSFEQGHSRRFSPDTALRLSEELRQDDALLRAFVAAECRLLVDLGVDTSAVERLRRALTYVLTEGPKLGEAAEPQMRELLHGLEAEFDAFDYGDADQRWADILGGLFRVLGGGLLVTTNAIVGAGLSPVSGGLSVGGAALSAVAGGELVSRGLDSALTA